MSKASGPFFWWYQLFALITKEYKEIVRDPSSYLVAGLMPMIFLLLFGYGITLDVRVLDICILDQSGGQQTKNLVTDFARSPSFRLHPAATLAEAERLLRDSHIKGILVIRQNADAHLLSGQSAAIQILVDGSDPNTANFIYAYAQGVIQKWQAGMERLSGESDSGTIALEPRYWYNPTADSHQFLVPGSITVIMTLIGTLLTSLVLAREWERGTMEAMFATPASRMQILLGKLIPYFCMGLLSMALCTAAAIWLFHVPFRGSLFALFLLSSIFLLTALGQGLLISVLTRTQLLAAQAGMFTGFMPALLLSGFVFDINSMPLPLQYATLLVPARYFNTSLQTIFLAGDVWPVFWPCIGAMLALAVLLLGLVYANLRKSLDK